MPYDDRDAEVEAEIAKLHTGLSPANCAHCGSDKIIPDALISEELGVAVMADPEAFIFKGRESQAITGRVCGNCGFIQLFAKSPEVLYSVYQQSKRNAAP